EGEGGAARGGRRPSPHRRERQDRRGGGALAGRPRAHRAPHAGMRRARDSRIANLKREPKTTSAPVRALEAPLDPVRCGDRHDRGGNQDRQPGDLKDEYDDLPHTRFPGSSERYNNSPLGDDGTATPAWLSLKL